MNADIVQIIVAVIGISGPIILELIRQRNTASLETTEQPPRDLDSPVSEPLVNIKGAQKRNLLDLSIMLLYGAFFSTILAHSLLVSGRVPNLKLEILIKILLITILTTGTLVLGWYWRKGELTVGILSITTLVVLLLSPGGPIIADFKEEGESGLFLMFPLFVLVLLATTSAIYHFGNPLSKNTPHRSRYKVILLLSGLLIISSITLGQQYVDNVSQDDLTPKFTGNQIDKAEEVLSNLREKKLPERGLFYRLGSEIALSEYYRNNYFQVLSSITEFSENNDQARNDILNSLKIYFNDSPINPLPYLADRLLWIHPTVREGNTQLNIELPGKTAQERLKTLSNRRIIYAMLVQSNILSKFLPIFNYSTDVTKFWDVEQKTKPQDILFSKEKTESEKFRNRRKELENLFPPLLNKNYTYFLRQELALPNSEEAYIVYSAYAKFAPSPQIKNLKNEFYNLPPLSQRAFITYIAENYIVEKNGQEIYKNYNILSNIRSKIPDEDKTKFPELQEVSSTDILSLATLIDSNTNANPVSQKMTPNLRKFANAIYSILKGDKQGRKEFRELLNSDIPEVSVSHLFNQKIYDLIDSIESELDNEDKINLFSILRDPVTPTIQKIVATLPSYDAQKQWLTSLLTEFTELTPENQEAILHHLAIATYRAQGVHSLDALPLLIFQAQSLSYWLAFLCATILMLPIIALATLSGGFFGSKLVERDRIRELIAVERSYGEQINQSHTMGIPVELRGRENLIKRLRNLSGRGWSTIAVVGRRGIGKSRILYELYQPTIVTSPNYGVKAWISAPSQYQEEDFIESILEQLAFNAEKAVADYLGALPFAVRQLEGLLASSGLVIFIVATSIIAAQLFIIQESLDRPEVMITWFPILLVIVASIICLIVYISHLQPLDLSPWLENDRSHSPDTVLLYRRIQEIFKHISFRHIQTNTISRLIGQGKSKLTIISELIAVVVGIFFFILLIEVLFWIVIIALLVWIFTSYKKRTRKGFTSERGASLMSLIAEYRNFATTVVYRLEQGALGQGSKNVMICIDELDKIVELDELRNFLRRMKGIFEVPGVYYYLSLSEDALAALYLGSAEGKNEVDSSLDHIVRIPPLSWEKSQEVAKEYLVEKRGVSQLDSKMVDVLVTISFGIPRDILRRCDELIAGEDSVATAPQELVNQRRKEQVEIAADSHEWSIQQRESLKEEAFQSSKAAKQALEKLSNTGSNLRESRVLVLIWILCCIECAHGLEDSKRRDFLKKLYDLGYSITLSLPSDLIAQINLLESNFLL